MLALQSQMNEIESLTKDLPDAESAERFLVRFQEKNPSQYNKLYKNKGLLSDVLTLVSFSPLLATTIQQNPNYLWWLNRHRSESKVRGKDELLESLARFSLTNSEIETQILLARFRRRELLRIYLRDIRRLSTIAEITEEISNLADAILEHALQIAKQELNNRFGIPLETDEKGRAKQSEFCIVSLGKLGSKELNYSSDIDLLFIYSAEGETSGQGTRGAVTNREYFVKLSEFVVKLVGQQIGEGAAYRVDLRLRPHGRIGALALSLKDTIRYYRTEARNWEKQVLIRSRTSAGSAKIYKFFFSNVEDYVFSKNLSVEDALENVRLSKEKINLELNKNNGFNVKLEKGGIREIEFIAQALQLAYGGNDEWLRSPHTLISLSRLADRELLSETELTELFDAYEFLRHLEHILQMENGLQTHIVPLETGKRTLIARRMSCSDLKSFDDKLIFHTTNVSRIFTRVFGEHFSLQVHDKAEKSGEIIETSESQKSRISNSEPRISLYQPILSSLEKSDLNKKLSKTTLKTLEKLSEVSPHFAEMIAANPSLINGLPNPNADFNERNYREVLFSSVQNENDFAQKIAVLRKVWANFLLEIVVFDLFEKFSVKTIKKRQTELAEASLEVALSITKSELEKRYLIQIQNFPFAVLGLGKLGGRGMDYGSDLDLVLIFDDAEDSRFQIPNSRPEEPKSGIRNLESGIFYARAVEIFVTALSAMTREGHLYRVDLRLRPDGKNGATSIGKNAFLNYLENRSAIWEWLAYIKIRGVAGDINLAESVEKQARKIIHNKAQTAKLSDLSTETLRVRRLLEEEKSNPKKGKEVDIKFGAGGMLDVYFAVRFLQLRDNVPDDTNNRSTDFMLEKLHANKSLSDENFKAMFGGYLFLKELDHNLRLTVGRSTRLPVANQNALQIISRRMNLSSINDLLEKLTFHRLNIRASFENILEN
jgi:[glutamine synthetase] adenylyltransferase / [glutamine synthetase]-adenylyl-L-tyrosine phosphorylase